ncbi:MAG: hypothetical protein ACREHD_25340 [Pirellulales bacterium]
MKRAILLLVVVVGGAFYLGWFTFTTDDSGQTEHVNIVIDKNKVHQDEARAIEKLHSFEQQAEAQKQSGRVGFDFNNPTLQGPAPLHPESPSSTQPGGFAPGAERPLAGGDPYEQPENPRPATRPAAETAESFSRGFQ